MVKTAIMHNKYSQLTVKKMFLTTAT